MSANQKIWRAEAPSNIALIKYMGKFPDQGNLPTNSSLSYTLGHLLSFVELQSAPDLRQDTWSPLALGGETSRLNLSERGQQRFLAHLGRIKKHFSFTGFFQVRSANNFPSDCGLASSASSFAALTRAAVSALTELTGQNCSSEQAAELSRQGSGSSCRSFFAPWSIWDRNGVGPVSRLNWINDLSHQVVIVDDSVKAVSSSEAHIRVASSLLFEGRNARAEARLVGLTEALATENWRDAFEITWAEFNDMHALFSTSRPAFSYMTAGSLAVMHEVTDYWNKCSTGPLVTMDAGANVHLLYRSNAEGRKAFTELSHRLGKNFRLYSHQSFCDS